MLEKLKQSWSNYAILFIFIFLLIISSILSPYFFSIGNILNLLRQQSFLFFVSIGMLFTILIGGIDLSVGSQVSLYTVLMAVFIEERGFSPFLSIVFVLFIGIVLGLLNGLLIEKVNINAFILTLATMSIFSGFAYIFCGGHPIFIKETNLSSNFRFIGGGDILNVHFPVIFSIVLALIFYFILKYMVYGRRLFGIGGSREAAKFVGINVSKYAISTYMISGFLCANSAIFLCSRLAMAHAAVGQGYELDAIASVIMGGAVFTGGKGSIPKTAVGVLVLGLIRNLLNLLNVPAFPQLVFKGLIIIFAVALSNLQDRAIRISIRSREV